ncbi:hypothetical protein ILYODFUR_037003 [Ilyodon furcidens]|uniref:Uncharacterized protein n=1 Tax=Ilyodon furcidens TaxID=33524 RepID=A0ABV0UM67_9TELE
MIRFCFQGIPTAQKSPSLATCHAAELPKRLPKRQRKGRLMWMEKDVDPEDDEDDDEDEEEEEECENKEDEEGNEEEEFQPSEGSENEMETEILDYM